MCVCVCVCVCLCVLYVGVSKLAALYWQGFMLSSTYKTYTRVTSVEFVLTVNQTIQPAKSNLKRPLWSSDRCRITCSNPILCSDEKWGYTFLTFWLYINCH